MNKLQKQFLTKTITKTKMETLSVTGFEVKKKPSAGFYHSAEGRWMARIE